jgi:aspartate carbamoyltransferase regulatory subunit
MAYYEGMVAIMSFYLKEREMYANISLTEPGTIKSFINMSSFYKKYGISIPNVLDKIMYRKVPT